MRYVKARAYRSRPIVDADILYTVMKSVIVAGLLSLPAASQAVIVYGPQGRNTTAPTGTLTNSGWQYQGQWGAYGWPRWQATVMGYPSAIAVTPDNRIFLSDYAGVRTYSAPNAPSAMWFTGGDGTGAFDMAMGIALDEARRMGLSVRAPHVNYSGENFVCARPDGTPTLFMGLDQVTELTGRTIERIVRGRPFTSLEDFLARAEADGVAVRRARCRLSRTRRCDKDNGTSCHRRSSERGSPDAYRCWKARQSPDRSR